MKVLLYTFYNRWRVSCRAIYEFQFNEYFQKSKHKINKGTPLFGNNESTVLEDNLMCEKNSDVGIEKFYYGRFTSLRKILIKNNFDYILGIANGNKNAKYIRIEQVFVNRFGMNKILPNFQISQVWKPTWDIKIPNEYSNDVKFPDNFTTGPCNRSVVNILDVIRVNNLRAKVAFVHLKGGIMVDEAKEFIFNTINNTTIYNGR